MPGTAEATTTRDATVVEADLTLIKRHLRRKVRVDWGRDNDDFLGTTIINGKEWLVELSYEKKFDCYRFRFERRQDHSDLINRRFDVTCHNAYTLLNDVIAFVATERLKGALDLEQD